MRACRSLFFVSEIDDERVLCKYVRTHCSLETSANRTTRFLAIFAPNIELKGLFPKNQPL